jgi:5-methylcytosine-specific restriction endonuclease McrA
MARIDNKKIREKIFNKYNGHCAYCGCELSIDKFTIDHIEPKFRGYTNDQLQKYNRNKGKCSVENFNPCCQSCNSSKSTFTLEKWRDEINKKFERCKRDNSNFRLLLRFGMIKYDPNFKFYFEKQ